MILVPRASIRTWLLALAVMSVVPLALFSMFVVNDLALSRQELLGGEVEARAVGAANAVAQQLYQVATVLNVLARSNNAAKGDLNGLRTEAAQALAVNPAIRSISLINGDGRRVFMTGLVPGEKIPAPGVPEVYSHVIASGQTVLSGPFTDDASGEMLVAMGVPVVVGGRVVFCLRADLRIGTFTELLEKLNVPAQWTVAVFDAKGINIGRSKEAEAFVGMAANQQVRQAIQTGEQGLIDSVTEKGVPFRVSLVRVPGWNWLAAVGAPRATLYEPLYRWLGAIIVVGGMALIGAVLWALWLSGVITARIGQTSSASVALRDGRQPTVGDTNIRELDELGETLATAGRLQERLRASEEQLRLLADSTSDMIARIDSKGRYLFVSAASRRLFGIGEEYLVGHFIWEFVHPEDIAAVQAALDRVVSGDGQATVRFRRSRSNGSYVWVETAISTIYAEGRPLELVAASRDITEQKQNEDRLQLAASVFAETSEGIVITDVDANIIDVNPAFTEITGYSREEAIGHNPRFLQSGHHDKAFYQAMWTSIRETGRWQGEILDRRRDGGVQPQQMTISTIRDDAGNVIRYVSVFADISERKREQERMERLAYHDALTRLPNRVLLGDRLERALARAARNETMVAVCYLDLDGFKPVNDQYGHKAGDAVLRRVARCLEVGVRGQDTVARLGGDEFVLVLEVHSANEWRAIVNRVLALVAEPSDIGEGRSVRVTACVGVAIFPEDGRSAETLLHHADEALYAAKRNGPGEVRVFAELNDARQRTSSEDPSGLGNEAMPDDGTSE